MGCDGPEKVVERLEWLSQQPNVELPTGDAGSTDLAMALSQTVGRGPWLQWLYERGLCQEGATDGNGRTVEDYVADFEAANSLLSCLQDDDKPSRPSERE